MVVRIRRSGSGYMVDLGNQIEEQGNPLGVGCIMKTFIIKESHRCDTLEAAQRLANQLKGE